MADYNRPNQSWECGWKKRGFTCHDGPSPKGRCPGRGECRPIKKDGGYECTRLPKYGGKCHQGPLPDGECSKKFPPCSPKRSLRAKRKLASLGACAFFLGLIYFHLGQLNPSSHFFSPGNLSSQHSSVLHNCTTCHSVAHGKPFEWLFGSAQKSSSESCLGCHSMGQHPLTAHSLSPAALQEITASMGGGKPDLRQLQCTTCHKEHRGEKFDLTSISDKKCQSCHSKTFASFEKGHPEFGNYPFTQRVKILFDHTSHFSKHFEKKKRQDISCQTCHMPSSSGQHMVLNGFDQTCASCHADKTHGENSTNKGVVFFGLPILDLESLKSEGRRVGEWPENADSQITPFMKLLLSQDEDVKTALQALEEDEVELDDLSDAEESTLEHVETVVWGIKRLLQKLMDEGFEEYKDLLKAGAEEISTKDMGYYLGSMSVDVLRSAAKDWFPSLTGEMEALDDEKKAATRLNSAELEEYEDEDWMKTGGWYRSNSDYTIRYRPTGHGDRFIRQWLNLAAAQMDTGNAAEMIFQQLSHPKDSPGACMKCHGVEQVAEAKTVQINWWGSREIVGRQDFMQFSHSSHLNLIKDKGCFTCHSMNEEADFAKAFKGYDPSVFESNFFPLKKKTCMKCHGEGQVSSTCTTCHNYHVGDFFTSESQMKRVRTEVK